MLSVSITMHEADESSVEMNSNSEFRIKDSGITTNKFADGSVTAPKLTALNIVSSASCGNFVNSNMTPTWTAVTNLSVSITTNGRPVMVLLTSDGSGNGSVFQGFATQGSILRFLRNGTEIADFGLQGSGNGALVFEAGDGMFMNLESSLGASTYTYTVEIKGLGNTNTYLKYFKLVAYEL